MTSCTRHAAQHEINLQRKMNLVEITKLEAAYIRTLRNCPDTVIYRTVHKYLMSEELNAMKALAYFRSLSVVEQKNLLRGCKKNGI